MKTFLGVISILSLVASVPAYADNAMFRQSLSSPLLMGGGQVDPGPDDWTLAIGVDGNLVLRVGDFADVSVTATGGASPITLSLENAPEWVDFTSDPASGTVTGQISGTPWTVQAPVLRVRATDAQHPAGVTEDIGLTVLDVLSASIPAQLEVLVGNSGSVAPANTTGVISPIWSHDGSFPGWISWNGASGTITANPSIPGTFSTEVFIEDPRDARKVSVGSVEIIGKQRTPIAVEPATDLYARVNAAFSKTFTATGGDGSLTFAAPANLPGWATYANGTIAGTPTVSAPAVNLAMTASDGVGGEDTETFPLSVLGDITITLPTYVSVIKDAPVDYGTPSVSGASPVGISFSHTGTLPPGLQVNAETGEIYGTPTQSGTFSGIRLVVIDDLDGFEQPSAPFSITVTEATAPTWVGIGAFAGGTSQATVAPPSGIQDGDLLVMVLEFNGTGTVPTPSGWADIYSGNNNNSTYSNTRVVYKRVSGAQANTVVTGSGLNHLHGIMFAVRGVSATGTPYYIIPNPDYLTSATSGVLNGFTAPVSGLVAAVGIRSDDSSTAAFTWGGTGGIAGITERVDTGNTTGDGGGFSVATGTVTAGQVVTAPSFTWQVDRATVTRTVAFGFQ